MIRRLRERKLRRLRKFRKAQFGDKKTCWKCGHDCRGLQAINADITNLEEKLYLFPVAMVPTRAPRGFHIVLSLVIGGAATLFGFSLPVAIVYGTIASILNGHDGKATKRVWQRFWDMGISVSYRNGRKP